MSSAGTAQDSGAAQDSEAGAAEEEVVDAEFSEVDDENKG